MVEQMANQTPDIPNEVLQDLCSRFIINIPENEKNNMVRICFQIEQAHWYYLDFCRQEDQELPPCGMKSFIDIIFTNFDFLNKSGESVQTIYDNWRHYKVRVPVYGAILLDESLEKCLLVQGYHKKASWGFPKGKVNKDEEGIDCAIREVLEEVGYDIKPLTRSDQYLENNFHDHQVRLYIVPGVSEYYPFKPNTRGEIKEIKWFNISDLPTNKRDMKPKETLGLMPNNFFMVHHFVKPLRKWISDKKDEMSQVNNLSKTFSSPQRYNNIPKVRSTADDRQNQQQLQEEEQRRRQQKKREKEEQFLQMHLIQNPLKSNKESENALKAILGMNRPSKTLSPSSNDLNSKHQSNVTPSPKRNITPDKYMKRNHSPKNPSFARAPGSKTPTKSYSILSRENQKKSTQQQNQQHYGLSGHDDKNSSFQSINKHKNKQSNSQANYESNNVNDVYGQFSYFSNTSAHERLQQDNLAPIKILSKPPHRLSEFEYSAPAFINFKLDHKPILAVLTK